MRGRRRVKPAGPHKNFVASLREARGITQTQLGEMTSIGWRSIGRLERGEIKLHQIYQEKIAKALQVSIRDLTPAEGGSNTTDAPIPGDIVREVDRLTTEFTLAMGDRLKPGTQIDNGERARIISEAAAWMRDALSQVAKRGGRS